MIKSCTKLCFKATLMIALSEEFEAKYLRDDVKLK